MKYSVGFEDKQVVFTDAAPQAAPPDAVVADGGPLPVTKVLQIAENNKTVYRISTDPAADFRTFCRQFRLVDAAGGVVADAEGNVLMILRNGRWDLPKGHREAGETAAECAVREVGEECGVMGVEVGGRITETYHFYWLGDEWTLKRTIWFRMRSAQIKPPLHPQTEEEIVSAEWVAPEDIPERISRTYTTIREVFRAADSTS